MRITFVYLGAESLAIEYLSSLLKREGHKVTLAYDPALFMDLVAINMPILNKVFNYEKRLLDKITRSKPDLVSFSVFTANYRWAVNMARKIKRRIDTKILFGGPHPTAVSDRVIRNPNVDFSISGEAEKAFVELVNALERKEKEFKIPGVWYKGENGEVVGTPTTEVVENLDSLPLPDKELFSKEIPHHVYSIMASRGCPFLCTFCNNSFYREKYRHLGMRFVRQRSIDGVINELKTMKKRYNFKLVNFFDDILGIDKNWMKEFLIRYKKEVNVPFMCEGHTAFIDEEKVKWLKEAGCVRIKFGVQSGVEENRKKILRRYERDHEIEKVLDMCDKVKLGYHLDHIFLPFESEEDQLIAAKFYSKRKQVNKIWSYSLTYFPKTPIVNQMKEMSLLNQIEIDNIETGGGNTYLSGGSLNNEKMREVYKNFEVYFKLIPVLPISWRNFILEKKVYRVFRYIPNPVVTLAEIYVAVKRRDYALLVEMQSYIRYYLKQIPKVLFTGRLGVASAA